MVEISVIVTIFNVQNYLDKCLESIVNQTFRDIEILLIDDGSSDNSFDICRYYEDTDERVQVLRQENQGVSAARNKGLKYAQGKFVLFVDGDDYIEVNALEVLYNNIVSHNADMATCGIYNVYQNIRTPQYKERECFVTNNEEAYRLVLVGDKIPGSICNKLLKKEKLKHIEFPVGKHYEDVYFHALMMPLMGRIIVDTTPLYNYVHRARSITTGIVDRKSYDVIEAYKDTMLTVNKYFPRLRGVAKFRIIWAHFVIFDRILLNGNSVHDKRNKMIKNFLKRSTFSVVCSKYFYLSRKIGALVIFFNYKLYRKLLVINEEKYRKIID